MKTVIIRRTGGPEVLEIADLPAPAPKRGEVLIRTRAMGVSRPDVLIRKGVYTWMPPLPASPGNELTGVVEALGAGVTGLREGGAVLLSARDLPVRGGCYTELIAVPEGAVHPLPAGIDFDQAVVLPTYLVAYAMMTDLGLRTDVRSVFVTGASGAVGGALVELARGKGWQVIGSAGSDEKLARVRALGAEAINYRTESVIERIKVITNGRGVDLVFDHIIGRNFTDYVHVLADFGALVFYNIHAEMPDKDLFREMCAASTRSPAVRLFNMHTYDHAPERRKQLTREVIALLAAGQIRPHVGARLPMAQAAEAHRLLESGSVVGKIVLHP